MNRVTNTVLIAIALYWGSLVYGCFVVHVVTPTDFYKESGVLLVTVGAVHLPSPTKGKDVTVEGENVQVEEK